MNFAGPAAALAFTQRIDVLVAVLVAGRLLGLLAHWAACWWAHPELLRPISFNRSLARPLLSFGGWMTVSNVISPMMSYLNRFLVGGMVSMSAVAYYVTPFELVTKLSLIPGAVAAVLFPAFATSIASDPARAEALLDRGCRYVFLAVFPAVLAFVVLASPGLDIWLGPAFRDNGTRVMQWLAAGILLNSVANIPFAFVQGAGRPDWTARLHVVEVVPYLLLLWWALGRFGIAGAAAAWFVRAGVDAIALIYLSSRIVNRRFAVGRMMTLFGTALVVLLVGALVPTDALRAVFLVGSLLAFFLLSWRSVLDERDRAAIRTWAVVYAPWERARNDPRRRDHRELERGPPAPCLRRVDRQEPPHRAVVEKVVVVDNASTDSSLEGLAGDHAELLLRRNSENLGFGAACNLGARLGQGDLLLFLNPDARLTPAPWTPRSSCWPTPHVPESVDRAGAGAWRPAAALLPHPVRRVDGPEVAGYRPHRPRAGFPATRWRNGLTTRPAASVSVIGASTWFGAHSSRRSEDSTSGSSCYWRTSTSRPAQPRRDGNAGTLPAPRAYHRGGGTSDRVRATRLYLSSGVASSTPPSTSACREPRRCGHPLGRRAGRTRGGRRGGPRVGPGPDMARAFLRLAARAASGGRPER